MKILQNIFRAYDIRGTYPDTLNADTAKLIGQGFASWLIKNTNIKNPTIAVGRDNRTHGLELQKSFIEGLISCGCNVSNFGLCTSPYLYFANTFGEFDAGCNITASHNPKEYNGFKLMKKNAHAVFGDDLQEIYKIIEKGEFVSGDGVMINANLMDDYFSKIKSIFSYNKKLNIAIDTGNGVAGSLYPSILRKLGHNVYEIYTELDGTFPNHEPDPIIESNLDGLKKLVLDKKADIGIAFDGDGDRCSVITEKGEFIKADTTLMLLSKDVLSRHNHANLVYTVSNSELLFDMVREWGGNVIVSKVGHSYVENEMTKHNAILGGEQSGHFFLPEDYYAYDDALITACRVLKILSDSNKTISELFEEFPKTYSNPELRPYCDDNVKFSIIEKISEFFNAKYSCNTMDGVRISFPNSAWVGIRASNTSPCLSINMEAKSLNELNKIKDIILNKLKEYPEIKL